MHGSKYRLKKYRQNVRYNVKFQNQTITYHHTYSTPNGSSSCKPSSSIPVRKNVIVIVAGILRLEESEGLSYHENL